MKYWGLVFTLLIASRAFGGLYGELNAFFNTDSFTTTTSNSNSKMFYALDIYANLESKHYLFAGFHVDQVNFQETVSSTQTSLTSLNMGPMFLWVMDRQKTYSLSLGYNLVAKGTYAIGSSSEAVTGTGIFATLSAMPQLSENFYFGIKLNYYSLSYSQSTVGTTATPVSYSRSLIFPSIGLSWRN